jgi:hypothetical protein
MEKAPKRSRLKFWVIFGAIYLVGYAAGYLLLKNFVCAPPEDVSTLCKKSLEMWPFILLLPVAAAMAKFKAALRDAMQYRAQRNRWGNWKPPQ